MAVRVEVAARVGVADGRGVRVSVGARVEVGRMVGVDVLVAGAVAGTLLAAGAAVTTTVITGPCVGDSLPDGTLGHNTHAAKATMTSAKTTIRLTTTQRVIRLEVEPGIEPGVWAAPDKPDFESIIALMRSLAVSKRSRDDFSSAL